MRTIAPWMDEARGIPIWSAASVVHPDGDPRIAAARAWKSVP